MRLLLPVLLTAACSAPVPSGETPLPETIPPQVAARPDLPPATPGTRAEDLSTPADAVVREDPDQLQASFRVQRHPTHPLIAVVTADCLRDCSLSVTVNGAGVMGRELESAGPAHEHTLLVPALRAEETYRFEMAAQGASGDVVRRSAELTTGELGFEQPFTTVTVPGDLEGLVLTAYYTNQDRVSEAHFVALDADGQVVWFYRWPMIPALPPQLRQRPDGTFLAHADQETRIIDITGRVLQRFWSRNGEGDWHHDVAETADGHLLAMADEVIEVGEGLEMVSLLSDTVLEYDRWGRIQQRWAAADTLDTSRFPGPLSRFGVGYVLDWTHGNAVHVTPDEDGYVVSLRHQSWIVRVDRSSAEVDWILGEDGDFELMSGTWFNAQHDPTFASATDLLVYDNGTERHDFDGGEGTRIVRYFLDESSMQAWQTWEWEVPVYTPFIGGVQPRHDGDVFVTAGGRRDGKGSLYLVREDGTVQWSMDIQGMVFRADVVDSL